VYFANLQGTSSPKQYSEYMHTNMAAGMATPELPPGRFDMEAYKSFESTQRSQSGDLDATLPLRIIRDREVGRADWGSFSGARRAQLMDNFLPVQCKRVVGRLPCRVYTGNFSGDGDLFVAAGQDGIIRVYDTHIHEDIPWNVQNTIEAQNVQWTITDTDLSPGNRFLVFSSMHESVTVVDLEHPRRTQEFVCLRGGGYIFSVCFSHCGKQLLSGGFRSVQLADIETRRTILAPKVHCQDVNSAIFLDESDNLLVSGSDDTICTVVDRRVSSDSNASCGIFAGHLAGITHVASRGDGRYLITNSKDQTIKLWDIRTLMSPTRAMANRQKNDKMLKMHLSYDYRSELYPGSHTNSSFDSSVMTYKGHATLRTLIRSRFSPLETTAQKYIYSGSADSSVFIYDVLTGEVVAQLAHVDHTRTRQTIRYPVRDVSWHPKYPMICSSCWNHEILLWGPQEDRQFVNSRSRST